MNHQNDVFRFVGVLVLVFILAGVVVYFGGNRSGNFTGKVLPPGTNQGTPPCTITSFTAGPTSVSPGGSSMLKWGTKDCTTGSIDHGVGTASPIAGSSKSTGPLTATTTFTLTASGGGVTATATAKVTVGAPVACAINSFTADDTSIYTGETTNLNWSATSGCTIATVTDLGNVSLSGTEATPALSATKTYIFSVGDGSASPAITESITITVSAAPRCVINKFTATPTSVAYGASATLSWTTTNCDTGTINSTISASPIVGGSISTGPLTSTTAYTLTADTIPGATPASYLATVTVGADPDPSDPDDPGGGGNGGGGGGGGGSSTKDCNDDDDNDGDGLIDYPYDPGCTSTSDDDEYNAPVAPGTIAPTFINGVCAPYITTDISFTSGNNNAGDVTKLEQFLNIYQGEALVVNGIYEQVDVDAVNRFQIKYSSGVLSIWGLTAPTGFVGPTTRNKINSLICGLSVTCPVFKEYNSLTMNNNTPEVVTTKQVLQNLGFTVGALTPVYDQTLFYAMKAFQEKFHQVMLDPWGISVGTGYKYKTTNKYLNLLGGCDVGPIELDGILEPFDY
jgi:hypothetical protein